MSNEFDDREMKRRASNNNIWGEAAATVGVSLLFGALHVYGRRTVWSFYEPAILFA